MKGVLMQYETTVKEVNKALKLADEDKKIIIEYKDKIVVVCQISKSKLKKLI